MYNIVVLLSNLTSRGRSPTDHNLPGKTPKRVQWKGNESFIYLAKYLAKIAV